MNTLSVAFRFSCDGLCISTMHKGDKQLAITRLQKVAREGPYLGPYARIFALHHLSAGTRARRQNLEANCSRELLKNPLMKKELGKVGVLVASAQK